MFKQMNLTKLICAGVGALFLLIAIFSSFYIVDQGERTIVLRFGSVVNIAEPGFHFKLPIIDQTIAFNIRTQKHMSKIEIYSNDTQPAIITASLNFSINPAKVSGIYSEYGTDYYHNVIEPKLRALPKQIFGQYTAERIVQERDKLSAQISTLFEKEFNGTGIVPESYNVEDVKFSAAYEQAIEDKMNASVAVEKAKQQLNTEQQLASIKRTKADASAYERKAIADADAHAITVKGTSEAAVILQKSEALAKYPAYIEFMKASNWNGILPTTMIPGGAVPMIGVK